MILTFFSTIVLFFSFIGWGLILSFLNNFLKKEKYPSFLIINGIILLSIISFIISLFSNINIFKESILILISFIGFLFFRKKIYFNDERKVLFSFITICLILIFCSTFPPYILDHFGYYIPTISLLDKYGLVKGAANLDWTLGQQSFWHILESGINNTIDPFLRINLIVSLILLLYIYETKIYSLLVFIPISILFLQSPSPDLFIIYISLIVISEAVLKRDNYGWLLFISTFVCIVKLTAFWLPLFVFILSIIDKKYISIKYLSYSVILISCMLFKNIYSSSLPFFPVNIFGLETEWTPDNEIINNSNNVASLLTYGHEYNIEQINNFSYFERFINWINVGGIKSFFNILSILTLIIFTVFSLIKKEKIYYILLFTVFIKCLIIYSFSAQYRFFLDGIIVLIAVLIYSLNLNKKYYFTLCYSFSFVIMLCFCFPQLIQKHIPSFRLSSMMTGFSKEQLIKPKEYHIEEYKSYKIGNLTFNSPIKYPLCFDTPQPAINEYLLKKYHALGIFPQRIGEKISEGFYMKKLNFKEIKELKKNINNLDSINKLPL